MMGMLGGTSATGWASCRIVRVWWESSNVSRVVMIRPDRWAGLEWNAEKAYRQS